MTTKTKKIISLAFMGIFVITLTIGAGLHMNIIKLPYTVAGMHAQYDADYGDDRVLVGGSNNVFVGKVIEQVGSTPSDGIPFTQFSVEIIDNIKGKLEGTVVVNQTGGYKDGILYMMGGETGDALRPGDNAKYLLQPGSTYLFATRGNSVDKYGGFYWLSPYPTALKLISSDEALPSEQLVQLAKNDTRVQALQEAYPDEIFTQADIYHNRTPNSFKSLPLSEQERIKAEVEQMKTGVVEQPKAPESAVSQETTPDTGAPTTTTE
jgi:hypothetical protein